MSLSKEAKAILDLIYWIARQNDECFAVVGYKAMARTLNSNIEDVYTDEDVEPFLDELIENGNITSEIFSRGRKVRYFIMIPKIDSYLRRLSHTFKSIYKFPVRVAIRITWVDFSEDIAHFEVITEMSLNKNIVQIASFFAALDGELCDQTSDSEGYGKMVDYFKNEIKKSFEESIKIMKMEFDNI